MAPKRSAPPPPPVESSEETASDSEEEEEEEEEEIAQSPPAAAASKKAAPPPQKIQQPDASDEEDEDEDENEASEEEETEGEEEAEPNHAAPPSVTKNPPPPPPNPEESNEAQQQESAPKEAEVRGAKPPLNKDKKPAGPSQRSWSDHDELRILEALVAHRREHGTLPQTEVLEAALAGSLENSNCGHKDLMTKVRTLKARYKRAAKRGDLSSKDRDPRIFDLSKEIWGSCDKAGNGTVQRDFTEMCNMFPYLAEEVKALEKTEPGLFKRSFSMIDDGKARVLDSKIKKQRKLQMKLELRRYDLTKEVTRTIMNLIN